MIKLYFFRPFIIQMLSYFPFTAYAFLLSLLLFKLALQHLLMFLIAFLDLIVKFYNLLISSVLCHGFYDLLPFYFHCRILRDVQRFEEFVF